MKIIKVEPYYPLYKINTGLYTPGGEFIKYNDLSDYIGLYHKLPNEQIWTNSIPSNNSELLLIKNNNFSDDVKLYNSRNNITIIEYSVPISYYPNPTENDYITGFIYRCFIQKRNNPRQTVMEIDSEQYNSLRNNNNGLNKSIWNSITFKWNITGQYAQTLNKDNIIKYSSNFPGLIEYFNVIGFNQFVK